MRPSPLGSRGRRSHIALGEIAVCLVGAESPARPPWLLFLLLLSVVARPSRPGGDTFGVFLLGR